MSLRVGAVCAAIAAVVALVLLEVGPKGGDWSAHVYKRDLFLEHGLTLWNNEWYAGRYSFVTYSVLYYPLAAALGIRLLAVLSVAGASFAYAVVVTRQWGRPALLSAYAFAVVWASTVLAAAFPFLLGAALALGALALFQRGSLLGFSALAALTLAASPVAFVLLAILMLAAVTTQNLRTARWRAWVPALIIGALGGLELLVWRAFPDRGHYPFATADVVYVAAFCVIGLLLARGVEGARFLTRLFTIYLLVSAVVFVVSSPLGGNVVRLRLAALPLGLVVVALRGWRPWPACAAGIVLVGIWNLTPAVGAYTHDDAEPTVAASYWEPAVDVIRDEWRPGYRVHVVDTVGHWGAVHLPMAGFPIVRGWFRQHDFPDNALLYEGFTSEEYVAWLRRMAVSHVVLPDAPPDYSSRREARLLRSGRSGLVLAARVAHHAVYRVPEPRPVVVGAQLMNHDEVVADMPAAGTYRVAVHHSPYWRPSSGCIQRRRDGMMDLHVRSAGRVTLTFDATGPRVLRVLRGVTSPPCG